MVKHLQLAVVMELFCYGKFPNGGLNLLMDIIQYTPDILSSLTLFYNQLTANVPHCYPVKEEEFDIMMHGVTGQTDNADDVLDDESVLVAIQNGKVLAFIHVGHHRYGDDREVHEGVIRFLGYERGERQAAQTVLEKAEAYLKSFNVPEIIAFCSNARRYRYDFYHFKFAKLSYTLDHIQALLGHNGYIPRYCQVFLDWDNYAVSPIPSSLPVTLSVDWKEGYGQRPNCTVRAHLNGEKVGACESVCGGEFSSHPNAQNWVYTEWLGVDYEYQGNGLGKYLLLYSLQEMQKVGYRHASLSTECNEYLPILLYTNCGYRVVDWTYDYVKDIPN